MIARYGSDEVHLWWEKCDENRINEEPPKKKKRDSVHSTRREDKEENVERVLKELITKHSTGYYSGHE